MQKIDSLKIGAIRYSVQYVKDLHRGDHKLDGHIQHGQTKISVEADLSHQAATQTILHETLHAIATQIGRPELLKEPVIDALAFGLFQVLHDNPQFVKMITHAPGR